MPRRILHLLKWGPSKGCSPTPFTSLTFAPTPSILYNLTGGRSQGVAAVKSIWSGRVEACLLPARHGYLADSQDWDSVLILDYPAGARLQPEELGKEAAKDRFWLELLPGQDAVPAATCTSQHSAGDQCTRPAPGSSHPIQSAPSQDSVFPQQLSDWAQHAPDTPVHILSLLRFSPSSSSSSSSDNAGKSQGATVPDLAAERGCGARRVLAAGVMKEGGEFDQGCWDAVSIVEYPSRAALRDALMSEAHQRQFSDAAVFAVLPSDNAAAKL
ncbi:g1655 [Coccomyxa elongata]